MEGLRFYLSEGSDRPQPEERPDTVEGSPLPDDDLAQILARLPIIEGEEADVQDFRLPVSSLPAPRPGETITQTFPPQEAGPDVAPVDAGPLHVLRFSPEGDVPLAPYLSITFDQPMVALTSHEDLQAQDVPVVLDPMPEAVSYTHLRAHET